MSEPGPSLWPFYSFDTSAIINGRRDHFMPSTWSALWDRIDLMIAQGQIRAVDEVKRELARKSDEAHQWAKARKELFVPLNHDIQRATKVVLAAQPRLLAQHGVNRNSADPFVIALAMVREGTVVTQEIPSTSLKRPRMPDACEAVGVRWVSLHQFIDEQGWTVTIT